MNLDFTPQLPATFDLAHILLAGIAVILLIALILKPSKRTLDDASGTPGKAPAVAPVAAETTADKPIQSTTSSVRESSPDSALQFLSSLQQEARLIDFVQEDIGNYSDEEVGAAARVVHEGSKKAITEFFTLSPIRTEEEESRITLPEGFNASEVRLTGNVVGSAPFTGTLIHRGWRAQEVKLPKLSAGHDTTIVAPAEVEL
jgi:hypothetical protein